MSADVVLLVIRSHQVTSGHMTSHDVAPWLNPKVLSGLPMRPGARICEFGAQVLRRPHIDSCLTGLTRWSHLSLLHAFHAWHVAILEQYCGTIAVDACCFLTLLKLTTDNSLCPDGNWGALRRMARVVSARRVASITPRGWRPADPMGVEFWEDQMSNHSESWWFVKPLQVTFNSEGFPMRPWASICPYYMSTSQNIPGEGYEEGHDTNNGSPIFPKNNDCMPMHPIFQCSFWHFFDLGFFNACLLISKAFFTEWCRFCLQARALCQKRLEHAVRSMGTCDFKRNCKWHHPDKRERGN